MSEKWEKAGSYENAGTYFLKSMDISNSILYLKKSLKQNLKLAKYEIYKNQNDESSQIQQMKYTLNLLANLKYEKMNSIFLKIEIGDMMIFHTFRSTDLQEAILV